MHEIRRWGFESCRTQRIARTCKVRPEGVFVNFLRPINTPNAEIDGRHHVLDARMLFFSQPGRRFQPCESLPEAPFTPWDAGACET